MSESIFSLRWKTVAENNNNVLLATGFSCRCQLKNHGHRVLHPVQYLTGLL
jgi:Fe-S oxidoreductase